MHEPLTIVALQQSAEVYMYPCSKGLIVFTNDLHVDSTPSFEFIAT